MLSGGFWSAFTPSGYPDEPPLLEGACHSSKVSCHECIPSSELGINFEHIKTKSLAALNPFKTPDTHIMDDADLAGPLLFIFGFGVFLLFVSFQEH